MQDSHLVKCAKYWYYWNLKAEQFAEWTYRIEDLDSIWGEFEKRLGKTLQTTALQRIPKNVNTCGSHQVFIWEDLQRELTPQLYENIRHLSAKYGYLMPLLENNEGGKIDTSSF